MSPSLDILGESQPVPDPDAISGLASHYTSMSATMKDVHDQLTALQQDAHWTGSAATAFRANLSGLPGELTKAYDSYHDMGSTLSAYAQGVSDWLRKLTPAVNQANDVQHELEQARNALAQAQATGGDTAGLQARVNSLSGELQWYQGTIYRLFDDDLPALAGTCAQGIQNAENAGISNTFWGGLSQDLGDVGGVLATVGSDVGGFLMTVVVDPFKDLPGALAEVWEHPGSWKDWSNLLGDLSSCVGVLSLAFGGELLMVSSLALDTAHLGTDAVLVGEGEGS